MNHNTTKPSAPLDSFIDGLAEKISTRTLQFEVYDKADRAFTLATWAVMLCDDCASELSRYNTLIKRDPIIPAVETRTELLFDVLDELRDTINEFRDAVAPNRAHREGGVTE